MMEQEPEALRLAREWLAAAAGGDFVSDDLQDMCRQLLAYHEVVGRLRNAGVPCELFCPECGEQHIDRPQPEKGWTNPPHRTHECQKCGHLWRPFDVATFGVVSPEQTRAEKAEAALYELRQEVDEALMLTEGCMSIKQLAAERFELQQRLVKAGVALQFYANEANYVGVFDGKHHQPAIDDDRGGRARTTLSSPEPWEG